MYERRRYIPTCAAHSDISIHAHATISRLRDVYIETSTNYNNVPRLINTHTCHACKDIDGVRTHSGKINFTWRNQRAREENGELHRRTRRVPEIIISQTKVPYSRA